MRSLAEWDGPDGATRSLGGGALRWVGVLTCLAAAAPMLGWFVEDPSRLLRPRHVVWLGCLVAFIALLWIPEPGECPGCDRAKSWRWLLVQAALALALLYLMPNGIFGVFLVIVAAGVGQALPLRVAFVWIGAQTAAALPAFLQLGGALEAVLFLGTFAGFQLFAAFAAQTAEQERRGRQELARVNAELTATRELLAETSRSRERLRIARDLHDVMGHHLTALSLNLETARHADPEAVPRHVETAREVTATLLREVRRVVGRMRDEGNGDDAEPGAEPAGAAAPLEARLARLAAGIERPRLHLEIDPAAAALATADQQEALLRCGQEMMTNAVRHSRAENVWLELARSGGGLRMAARDDGRGAEGTGDGAAAAAGGGVPGREVGGSGGDAGGEAAGGGPGREGHGLVGMRERVERLGGRLRVDAGDGFRVEAWLPLAEAATGTDAGR